MPVEPKEESRLWMYTAQGIRIGRENIGSLNPWTLWWDADPEKEMILKGQLLSILAKRSAARKGPIVRRWSPT